MDTAAAAHAHQRTIRRSANTLLRAGFLASLAALGACTNSAVGPGMYYTGGAGGQGDAADDLGSGADAAATDAVATDASPAADGTVQPADGQGSDATIQDSWQKDAPGGAVCGNGVCETGETPSSCSMDCKTTWICGNAVCEAGETAVSCPVDCQPPTWVCGNGVCEAGEDAASCAFDCKPKPVCGNGICETGETAASCVQDCKPKPVCGNGICEAGETEASCAADCKAKTSCGNGSCESGESAKTCALDCSEVAAALMPCVEINCPGQLQKCFDSAPCTAALNKGLGCVTQCGAGNSSCKIACQNSFGGDGIAFAIAQCAATSGCLGAAKPVCGDGVCADSETPLSCQADCKPGPICGDGVCEGAESKTNCAADCKPITGCGDGVCAGNENATTCALDCDNKSASLTACVKGQCPAQYAACMADSACVSAANQAMLCVANCGSGNFSCTIACQGAGGTTAFAALTNCALMCFLAP